MVLIKKDVIELRKSGKFYNCFGDDAIIIHYLLGYKYVPAKGGVGFPESAYNKVINNMEDAEVSYIVYDNNNVVAKKDFKRINCYKDLLKKGLKELNNEVRYQKIEDKIKTLTPKELDHVLDVLEDAIS